MSGIGLAARYRRIVWLLLAVVAGAAFYFGWMQPRPIAEKQRERVASLHEIGALPKGYDGWLAHVEAELLAEGEEPPPDPLFPQDDILRCPPIIVDISAQGGVSLNATAMKSEKIVVILRRVFEGQTELSPVWFRVSLNAPLSSVEPVARAIVDAGFGDHLSPIVGDGEALGDLSRVYSIKLGGRFLRVPNAPQSQLAPR